jgi:hypothetical protein
MARALSAMTALSRAAWLAMASRKRSNGVVSSVASEIDAIANASVPRVSECSMTIESHPAGSNAATRLTRPRLQNGHSGPNKSSAPTPGVRSVAIQPRPSNPAYAPRADLHRGLKHSATRDKKGFNQRPRGNPYTHHNRRNARGEVMRTQVSDRQRANDREMDQVSVGVAKAVAVSTVEHVNCRDEAAGYGPLNNWIK